MKTNSVNQLDNVIATLINIRDAQQPEHTYAKMQSMAKHIDYVMNKKCMSMQCRSDLMRLKNDLIKCATYF